MGVLACHIPNRRGFFCTFKPGVPIRARARRGAPPPVLGRIGQFLTRLFNIVSLSMPPGEDIIESYNSGWREQNKMQSIAVTGGSGKLGRWVVEELQRRGYRVTSLDAKRSDQLKCGQLQVDMSDFGQVKEALQGSDAIIHLAAIPAPLHYTNEYIYSNNVLSTYHVHEAAALLGIRKVVSGSSESAFGFAWAPEAFSPDYFPVDENHRLAPRECYGLSKVVGEQTGAMFSRRTGMRTFALRYSMIVAPNEYERLGIGQPERFKKILWSYVDIRDAVSATIAALESEADGFHALNVTSDDTLSDVPTETLLDRFYPEVRDLRKAFSGREAVVDNGAAKRILGWAPAYSWERV